MKSNEKMRRNNLSIGLNLIGGLICLISGIILINWKKKNPQHDIL